MRLHALGATELAQLIRTGAASAREVILAALARIEAVNPGLNAIVQHMPKQALADADAIDRSRAAGEQLPGGSSTLR